MVEHKGFDSYYICITLFHRTYMALHARSYLYFGCNASAVFWIRMVQVYNTDGPPDTAGGRLVSHVISFRKLEQPRGINSPLVYMALPTHGRVLLDTTAGDIDIELWSKVRQANMTRSCLCKHNAYLQEAPKACRNFIALAMEGTHRLCLSRSYVRQAVRF